MNKKNISAIKKEELLKDIAQLEGDVTTMKEVLYTIEKDEKLQSHEKNVLEVKKDDLSRSIQFYKNETKKMRITLSSTLAKHSKFSMAAVCYNKLLEGYRNTYLHSDSAMISNNVTSQDMTSNTNPMNHIEVLEKQIVESHERIVVNRKLMTELLRDLEHPSN